VIEIYQIAKLEKGVSEIPGAANNERIVGYHESTSIGRSDDEVPWCSSFVNWCCEAAGYVGTDSPAARSWLKWGRPVAEPYEGCIVVLKRGTSSWQGHVGFFVKENERSIWVLGGNQSNQVNISRYSKSKVLGYRDIEGKNVNSKSNSEVRSNSSSNPVSFWGRLVSRLRFGDRKREA